MGSSAATITPEPTNLELDRVAPHVRGPSDADEPVGALHVAREQTAMGSEALPKSNFAGDDRLAVEVRRRGDPINPEVSITYARPAMRCVLGTSPPLRAWLIADIGVVAGHRG